MADAVTLKRTAKNKNFVSLLCFFFNLKKKNQNTLLISRKKFDEKMADAVAVAMTQMFFIIKHTDNVNIK